jgi:uncharacterized FAD-dependent dehydrogenase
MIRIHEVKLKICESTDLIPKKIAEKCRLEKLGYKLLHWEIIKESIDARDKADINFVYGVDFKLDIQTQNTEELFLKKLKKLDRRIKISIADRSEESVDQIPIADRSEKPVDQIPVNIKKIKPPIVAGFGPCGMFAGLILAERGLAPIIIERGKPVDERVVDVERFWNEGILNDESNVQFGEGGAGTFSDGKLTTGINDPRKLKVLREFAAAGGGDELLYRQKPHIGTDRLRIVVKNIRNRIIELGGTVLFQHKLSDLVVRNNCIKRIILDSPKGRVEMETDHLVLAIGHSARDTFRLLYTAGLSISQKPFSIGLRIEHPQLLIDAAQYGRHFEETYGITIEEAGLPAADYKLTHRCVGGRGAYTFCMCPGGSVIGASSQRGMLVTNGMSNSARDSGFANSALLVDVRTSDFASEHPLAGVDFQEKYERKAYEIAGNYRPLGETIVDFMNSNSVLAECLPSFAVSGIRECLPVFGRKLSGFDMPSAMLYGVESRSSSPVRFFRSESATANIGGVYPGGEGAGYAGGIMSAAVDGIRIAESILMP